MHTESADLEIEKIVADLDNMLRDNAEAPISVSDIEAFGADLSDAMFQTENEPELTVEPDVAPVVEQVVVTEPVASDPVEPKSTKKARSSAPKKPAEPHIKYLSMKPSDAIRQMLGNNLNDYMAWSVSDNDLSEEALAAKVEERLNRLDELSKKQRERVINVMQWMIGKADLRTFTKVAMEALIAHGSLTSKELREVYIDKKYSLGTAGSVMSNYLRVLPALEFATRKGATLQLNEESTILGLFKARC